MPRDFSESDWKTLSHLKPLALERLCQRILQKADSIITHAKKRKSDRGLFQPLEPFSCAGYSDQFAVRESAYRGRILRFQF